jgi:hypothetical protein
VDISHIPQSHIDKLREDSSLATQFDKTYGAGCAAACMKPSGGQKALGSGKKDIPQAHIDKLLGNPGFASDFDRVYGAGESDRVLAEHGGGRPQALEAAGIVVNGKTIAAAHVAKLKAQPAP